jgi:hypothetical protein
MRDKRRVGMLAIFAAVHRSAIVEKPLLAHIVGDRIDVPVAFLGQ